MLKGFIQYLNWRHKHPDACPSPKVDKYEVKPVAVSMFDVGTVSDEVAKRKTREALRRQRRSESL